MQNHNPRLHGLASVVIITTAFLIGISAAFGMSFIAGIFSSLLTFGTVICIAMVYCSKCPCRSRCNHYFIGIISEFLSKPRTGNYRASEILFGVLFPLMLTIGSHLYSLSGSPAMLWIYLLLMMIGLIDIYFFVCTGCKNYACVLCKNDKDIKQ